VSSAASNEVGTLSITSSVADNIDTFGREMPILCEKSMTF